jgi:hypothetical protein
VTTVAEHAVLSTPFERLGNVSSWRTFTNEIHHRNALHATGASEDSLHARGITELAEQVVESGYLEALISCNPNALGDALAVLYHLASQARLDDGVARSWRRHAQHALPFCTELVPPDALLLNAYRGALGHGGADPEPELRALAVMEPLWAFRHHVNASQTDDFCKVVVAFAVAGWSDEPAAARCAAQLPALRDALLGAAAANGEALDVARLACLPPALVGHPPRALTAMMGDDPQLEPLRVLAQHVNKGNLTC